MLETLNARIFFRFLPMYNMTWKDIRICEDKKCLYVRCLQDFEKGRHHLKPSYWKFSTDGLYYNESQANIFDDVTSSGFLNRILEGSNAIILSYGQTGSGKTVTTSGLENTYEDRGILPRILEALFNLKEEKASEMRVCIKLSYVETNRNYIIDILGNREELLDMLSSRNVTVKRLKSLQHALRLIFKAEAWKTFSPNCKKYFSNMANSVVTLQVFTKTYATSETAVSKLHIVDLCGVDSVGNVSCLHKNGFDIGTGNLAKTQLEQFLLILEENNAELAYIKQRLCIVVNYLKDSLNSRSLLRFIGHLRASREDLMVTISMLRFGQIISGLTPQKLEFHSFEDEHTYTTKLETELAILKKEIALNSMLKNEDLFTNLSQEQMDYVATLADDYLKNKNGEIVILNTTDVVVAMKVFKDAYNKLQSERNLDEEKSRVGGQSRDNSARRDNSVLAKPTKRSIKNSSVSLTNSKKTSSRKLKGKRGSREDTSSMNELPTSRTARVSRQSLPKSSKVNATKRRSNDSSITPIDEIAIEMPDIENLPEDIPSHEQAWQLFEKDSEYQFPELNEQFVQTQTQIATVLSIYNIEVRKLKENDEWLETRQSELQNAGLLKDLENLRLSEVVPKAMNSLEEKCMENVKAAELQLIEQKERVLSLQTELKLLLETKSRLRTEIEGKFEEFCAAKFEMLLPNLSSKDNLLEQSALYLGKPAEIDEASVITEPLEPDEYTRKVINFNQLKQLRRKEYEKRKRNDERNKKWIQSFKILMEL